jgi:hypothetical protein
LCDSIDEFFIKQITRISTDAKETKEDEKSDDDLDLEAGIRMTKKRGSAYQLLGGVKVAPEEAIVLDRNSGR